MVDESVIELNLFTDMGKHGVDHQIDLTVTGNGNQHFSNPCMLGVWLRLCGCIALSM